MGNLLIAGAGDASNTSTSLHIDGFPVTVASNCPSQCEVQKEPHLAFRLWDLRSCCGKFITESHDIIAKALLKVFNVDNVASKMEEIA